MSEKTASTYTQAGLWQRKVSNPTEKYAQQTPKIFVIQRFDLAQSNPYCPHHVVGLTCVGMAA